MNNAKKLLGVAFSLLAALIAIVGVIGLGIYLLMMVVWFHVPVFDVLTFVGPLILIMLALAWLCNKAGIALRHHPPI